MKRGLLLSCAAATLLGGCAALGRGDPPAERPAASPDWRSIATADDQARLRKWRSAWVRALRQAQEAGHARDVAREGALLQPDAAIAWQDPPPGTYRCRTVKVGAKTPGLLDFVAYPAFSCRIALEDGRMSFMKLDGSQRPVGVILPHVGPRMVFLGTLQLGDERRPLQYGRDRERDMAGLVERIGERRWRLVFPYPHFESMVDVLELVPVADPGGRR